jgi:molecular chaperone GrpE (heat shock protein)
MSAERLMAVLLFQVRAPTIRGRPTPARKHKSSSILSSTSSPSSLTSKTSIPKALKRAEKRASLIAKTTEAEESKNAIGLLKEGEHSISKSSLRRRKRKAKDEIGRNVEAGRQGGVQELMAAVDDLEMALDIGDQEGTAEKEGKDVVSTKHSSLMTSSRGGKVTTNQRKRVL